MKSNSEQVGKLQIGVYGLGNFASQLSWTMVSSYIMLFYTDVAGLATGTVALLMLVCKLWDGINDPMMGYAMEHTHTRWGRFRPYLVVGSFLLVAFTIAAFSVPSSFSYLGKVIWAYVTYIGLDIAYTIVNVPYCALPAVMTDNPKKINRLFSANLVGMCVGMILLNLLTLPLVKLLGGGVETAGYQRTAGLYALIALPMFLLVAKVCKEHVTVKKETQQAVAGTFKAVLKNKNLVMLFLYQVLFSTAMFGRLGVAVYFYINCVQNFAFITVFMMMQMFVGMLVMPFAPKFMERFGKRNTVIIAELLMALSLGMMFFGPYTNIPYLFAAHIVYGLGYIAGPCGSAMTVDSLDDYELKNGGRPDGTAFSFNNLCNKVGSAVGAALGITVIGWFGYVAGADPTPEVQNGINIAANLVPMIIYLLAIVPMFVYNLTNESKMAETREALQARSASAEA